MGIGQGEETGLGVEIDQDAGTGLCNDGWQDWEACLAEVIDWDGVNDLVDSLGSDQGLGKAVGMVTSCWKVSVEVPHVVQGQEK